MIEVLRDFVRERGWMLMGDLTVTVFFFGVFAMAARGASNGC